MDVTAILLALLQKKKKNSTVALIQKYFENYYIKLKQNFHWLEIILQLRYPKT